MVCGECRAALVSAGALRRAVAWEDRRGLSFFRAFFATWREVVFAPRVFFGGLDPAGELFKPLLFAAICLAVGLFGSLWGVAEAARALAGPAAVVGLVVMVAAAPAAYLAAFAATVAFLHLLARGFGGVSGLRGTTRAVAYGQAAALAELLPAIGSIIAFVLRLSLYGWGVAAVHRLSSRRALAFYLVLLAVAAGLVYFGARLLAPFVAFSA